MTRSSPYVGLAAGCLLVLALGCAPGPGPIVVGPGQVAVFNQSDAEWRDVEIRVNRYYLVGVPALAAGGRFDVPLDRLQGGFGRYFDVKRERVRRVEVTATSTGGKRVHLVWPGSPDDRSGRI